MLIGEEGSILTFTRDTEGRGTVVTFASNHNLADGDQIQITSVDGVSAEIKAMYNTVHEVAVLTATTILINVKFSAADFPTTFLLSASRFTRTSKQTYKRIKIKTASPESRGYPLCWSNTGTNQADYVGPAGIVVIKDPAQMIFTRISLTSIEPDVITPMIVTFRTGTSSRYVNAVNSLTLKMTIEMAEKEDGTFEDILFPYHVDRTEWALTPNGLDTISTATQNNCGKIFLEMWGDHENGFPQPRGCYLYKDLTNA
jgi:hypothetical protein